MLNDAPGTVNCSIGGGGGKTLGKVKGGVTNAGIDDLGGGGGGFRGGVTLIVTSR